MQKLINYLDIILSTVLAQPSFSGEKSSAVVVLSFGRDLINSFGSVLPILFFSVIIILLWCISSIKEVSILAVKLILSFAFLNLCLFYIFSPGVLVNYSVFGTVLASNWYVCFSNIAVVIFALFSVWLRRISLTLLLYIGGAVIFSLVLLGSTDLITFYISFEALSLLTYGIVATNKTLGSSEGALKYFIYGVISSVLLIFGLSLYYISYQSIDLYEIYMYENFARLNLDSNILELVSVIFIVLSFCYKLSMFPFHFSLPDVYEGSSWETIAVINLQVKLTLALTLFRFWGFLISQIELTKNITGFLLAVAIFSLIIGCFGALVQTSLKRLFAYTSINQAGFIVLGLLTNNVLGLQASLIYLTTYMLTMFVFFVGISNETSINNLLDLRCLSTVSKGLIVVSLFSMAGIPPFFGFVAKYWIWVSLINGINWSVGVFYNYLIIMAFVISILVSLISAYYYLRLIKVYVFEDTQISPLAISDIKLTSILLSILIMVFLGLGWFVVAEFIYTIFEEWALDNYGTWADIIYTARYIEWLHL